MPDDYTLFSEKAAEGKTVIVTGGCAGIGAATAKLAAQIGADVFCFDLQDIPEELAGLGCRQISVNVADGAEVASAVEQVLGQTSRIDVVVNNAGITRDSIFVKIKDGKVTSMPDEEWDAVLAVHLGGVRNMCKSVIPPMVEHGGGSIVNRSSISAQLGNIGQTNYCAAKGAIEAFTKTLAKEVGRYGISVNAVAPGFTDTPMVKTIPEKIIEGVIKTTPLGRLVTPLDVARADLFLALSSGITGVVLDVDCGFRKL